MTVSNHDCLQKMKNEMNDEREMNLKLNKT